MPILMHGYIQDESYNALVIGYFRKSDPREMKERKFHS